MDWPKAAEPSVPQQESSAKIRVGQRQKICSLERYSYAVYLAHLIEPFESKLISKPPAKSREVGLSECMVRRSVASEKRTMAVGLRQCIRPLVESVTPGHDGYPLALVPINWTASK